MMGLFGGTSKQPKMTAAEQRAARKQAAKDEKAAEKVRAKAQAKADEKARKEGIKKLKKQVEKDARARSQRPQKYAPSSKQLQERADYTHDYDKLTYEELRQKGFARARQNQYGPIRKYR